MITFFPGKYGNGTVKVEEKVYDFLIYDGVILLQQYIPDSETIDLVKKAFEAKGLKMKLCA